MTPLETELQLTAIVIVVVGVRMITRWALPMRAPWLRKSGERG